MTDRRRPQPIVLELRALRKAKGMTQQRLASASGYSHVCVNRWETGISDPSIRAVSECAQALGVMLKIEVAK